MNNKIKILKNVALSALIIAIIGFTSCEKYVWDPPRFDPPDTTGGFDTIYYSTQLAPLFPQYNCTACHPGLAPPDLRLANSYESLTTGGHIDTDKPQDSEVVVNMKGPHMGANVFASEDINLFINWIFQGAMNN